MKEESYGEAKQETSVRALDKAIFILETLSGIDGDVDLASLSKQVKMPKSTLLRLLNTMKNNNLIRQDENTKRFSLGLGLVALGKAAEKNFSLAEAIHPFLVELAEKTGETASLTMLEHDHAVYIDQVVSKNMIRGQPRIGLSLDLHCSSGGKVLLSAMEDARLEVFLKGRRFKEKTNKTINDVTKLRKEIQKIREQGFAVDDEEVEVGGRCVAAPLRDKEGKVIAAISVMGPTTRIRLKDLNEIAQMVTTEVNKASYSLGYKPT